ncbi:hypothetical protein HMPREF1406_01031 [Helicobacter pylori GAM239Bi]|nr:hypothetical protein HMPREF1406_01031 [Helicobacter pylori GAM239Bi]
MFAIPPIELQVLDFYVIGFRNDFYGRIEAIFSIPTNGSPLSPPQPTKYNAKQLAPNNF